MDNEELRGIIEAAGRRRPCDVVLTGGKIVNVLTGEIASGDLGIFAGHIAGVGEYRGAEIIDVAGKYLCPGFIDSHIHIESSCLIPSEFARGVIPRGTTTIIADPHEIANVTGTAGIVAMHDDALSSPLEVYFVLPSCVPATTMETSGARLSSQDLSELINEGWVLGLGEVMNFPGVIAGAADLLEKILMTKRAGKMVDGHAPLVTGYDLSAYISAGIGSDHECTKRAEAREKLEKGMFIMIREGTDARNLDELIVLVNEKNFWLFTFVGDDITAGDLARRGYIDYFLRKAVDSGLDPVTAIRMATVVPALRAGLTHIGALSPGKQADVAVMDDLKSFNVSLVLKKGMVVARNGVPTFERDGSHRMPRVPMKTARLTRESLSVPYRHSPARVIRLIPGQIVTDQTETILTEREGHAVSDTDRDILKVAVIERHHATGNVAVGFVSGFGLTSGAIGSSVGHDSHNIIVVGANDEDMFAAALRIVELGGGQVVTVGGRVVSELALPVAGLMSDRPLEEVDARSAQTVRAAGSAGCVLKNPFMSLSFLPLPVIPKLRITDRGLVDVTRFDFVPLYLE